MQVCKAYIYQFQNVQIITCYFPLHQHFCSAVSDIYVMINWRERNIKQYDCMWTKTAITLSQLNPTNSFSIQNMDPCKLRLCIATFESQIIMHYQSWDCAISQCWDSTRVLKTVPCTVSTHNIYMFFQPLVCCASHLCSVEIACIILRLVVCKLVSQLWKFQNAWNT